MIAERKKGRPEREKKYDLALLGILFVATTGVQAMDCS